MYKHSPIWAVSRILTESMGRDIYAQISTGLYSSDFAGFAEHPARINIVSNNGIKSFFIIVYLEKMVAYTLSIFALLSHMLSI